MADAPRLEEAIDVKPIVAKMAALARQLILNRAFRAGEPAHSIRESVVRPLSKEYAWYKSGTRPYKNAITKKAAATRRGIGQSTVTRKSSARKSARTRARRTSMKSGLRQLGRLASRAAKKGLRASLRRVGVSVRFRSPVEIARLREIQAARREGRRPVLHGPGGWGPIAYTEGGRKRLGVRPAVADQVLSGGTRQAFGQVRSDATSITLGFRTVRAQEVAYHLQRRNQFFPLTEAERTAILKLGEFYLQEEAKKIRLRGSTISVVL